MEFAGLRKLTCLNFNVSLRSQCSFCKVHLVKEKYLAYHKDCCSEKIRIRKNMLVSPYNSKTEIERDRKRKLPTYRCIRCNYKTIYKLRLKAHLNEHSDLQPYWCESCHRCFKTKPLLNMHVENVHVNGEGKKPYGSFERF